MEASPAQSLWEPVGVPWVYDETTGRALTSAGGPTPTIAWSIGPRFKHPTGRGNGSDTYLALGLVISEGTRFGGERCDIWEPCYFRSVTESVPASLP
jgi:hypothetical protein